MIPLPFAYIDPNAGFQIVQQTGPTLGFLLAMLGLLLWPFRMGFRLIFNFFKKRPKLLILILAVLTAAGGYWFRHEHQANSRTGKVIVIGMDGLDPDIMDKMMAAGDMPNFTKLKEMGAYSRLGTVTPPQSPVAWSTFATGLDPGGHGLYDFLWRHTENYLPDLALSELKPGTFTYENRRKGKTLWTLTSEAGIPTVVMHCPVTFPPDKVKGHMLAGMGVPDILGTQGTFSLYTSAGAAGRQQGGRRIPVTVENGVVNTKLRGPKDPDKKDITLDLTIRLNADNPASLDWPGGKTELAVGRWSGWQRLEFPVGPLSKVKGMVRFYLKSTAPEFELYVSPVNFSPDEPPHPISYPNDYAKRLKDAIGDFHTLGMPHDTWALNEGAMTEEMFLEQSETIYKEERAMLENELPKFEKGLFIFVFENPDRLQHMFWRAIDPENPLYTEADAKKFGHVISDVYLQMDDALGYVMRHMDEKTLLLVISDHGFKSFRRAVHLNSWLRDNGYLAYHSADPKFEGKEFFDSVDWSRSRAYAVGLGSIYLNLKGREKLGVVDSGAEADRIKKEIAAGLESMKDDKGGNAVIRKVYMDSEVFSGAAMADAPDLIAGFEEGYRASWQTALGAAPAPQIEDNLKKWSGDHILDHRLVPGVIFSNRPLQKKDPTLYDLSPTLLTLFGIKVPADQKGSDLFEKRA